MTTYRSVAVVTETLRYLLARAGEEVPNTTVRLGPPEELTPGGGAVINLFLYHVRPTAYQRNEQLPLRNALGTVLHHDPTMCLELDYLVSFVGTKNTTESELLLGSVVRYLEAVPLLTEEVIEQALASFSGATKLSSADLAGPVEVYPLSLSTDERSRLWSVFFQVPYKLSMEYRARAVPVPAGLTPSPGAGLVTAVDVSATTIPDPPR